MLKRNLCESALGVNASVHNWQFCDALGMEDDKSNTLQRLFAKRLDAEMRKREMGQNELARLAHKFGAPKMTQGNISRLLAGQAPNLRTMQVLADALGVPAWYLLMEENAASHTVIQPPTAPGSVQKLAVKYPKLEKQPKAVKLVRRRTKVMERKRQ